MNAKPSTPAKKKHHFVPVGYLSRWCDGIGRIWAYRAEAPSQPLRPVPKEIGFEGHYYSQPKDDGTVDTNSLEDSFGTFESSWPPIVDRLVARQDANPDMPAIFEFIGLMRARVPAARDAAEAMLRAQVQANFDFMLKRGMFPPVPPELEGHLDRIKIPIVPWKTLEAMAPMAKGFAKVIDGLGFEIVHLSPDTGMTFLTSDNPVAYFDPDADPDQVEPYKPSVTGKLELLFPVGPSTLIRGHTDLKPDFAANGFRHVDMADPLAAARVNRLIARFGYRLMIAQDRSHDDLAIQYPGTSPVVTGKSFGIGGGQWAVATTAFGPKNPKVPWKEHE